MIRLGPCGELTERHAARAHRLVAILTANALVSLVGAVVAESILLVWHLKSVGVHERRAQERGE